MEIKTFKELEKHAKSILFACGMFGSIPIVISDGRFYAKNNYARIYSAQFIMRYMLTYQMEQDGFLTCFERNPNTNRWHKLSKNIKIFTKPEELMNYLKKHPQFLSLLRVKKQKDSISSKIIKQIRVTQLKIEICH